MKLAIAAVSVVALMASAATAQQAASGSAAPVEVSVDNFVRAETDLYLGKGVLDAGGIGKFMHRREPADVANQLVIRMNRDTLYSSAVVDLDAGPVTVTLPDVGERFMSLQVINEDQYTPEVIYGGGAYGITKDSVGTRYAMLAIRTLVDPSDPKDVAAVHALQDAIKLDQPGGPGVFEVPNWDTGSQDVTRKALLELAEQLPDTNRMFGRRDDVDPVRRLIGAASAWGGNPATEATYLNFTPEKNDGTTVYTLDVPKDVPVKGFWSVSRYNKDGYYTPNALNAYSLNNITAKKNADGSVTVQFGGCEAPRPTACRSRRAGTISCASTDPRPRSSMAAGHSRRRNR